MKTTTTTKCNFRAIIMVLYCAAFISCKKDWFAEKSDKSLIIPTTIQDAQALVDNASVMNTDFDPLGEAGADNYTLDYATFLTGGLEDRNIYIWNKDFAGNALAAWTYSYKRIFYANAALDALGKIDPSTNTAEWNRAKAGALFIRAYNFFQLADKFAKPYDLSTASSDLGIVLRRNSLVKEPVKRSSVQATYDQILGDLLLADQLMPASESTPTLYPFRTRITRTAILGLLARTYLYMGNYEKSLEYADASLKMYGKILDYNSLNLSLTNPIPSYSDELITQSSTYNPTLMSGNKFSVDKDLYSSYDPNDLRKQVFFIERGTGMINYRGSYSGLTSMSIGLTTSEILLIRAECYARKGSVQPALEDLNQLLLNRWKKGTFVPITAADAEEALRKILTERRKELVFRELRWMDLRRLNKDPKFAITLTRVLNGVSYTLPPNDPRYVYPIPNAEIDLGGIEQNIR